MRKTLLFLILITFLLSLTACSGGGDGSATAFDPSGNDFHKQVETQGPAPDAPDVPDPEPAPDPEPDPEPEGYTPAVTWGEYVQTYGKDLPIFSVDTDEKVIALTVDISWEEGRARELLELFDRFGIKATVFCMGYWVQAQPELAREFVAAGHSLQSHSQEHHLYMTEGWTVEDALAEILRASDTIESVCGYRPTMFRFPGGDFDNEYVTAVRGAGLEVIQWSVDSEDWKPDETAQSIYDRIMSLVHPGAILLVHDAPDYPTMEALPDIIADLLSDGWTFVTVDELLLTCPQFTIDFTGEMQEYE